MQKSRHFSKENCLLCGADFILLISYYFFKIVKLPIALQNDNLVTITREAIAFYTVIITLNSSLFKLILSRLLAAGCAATKYGVLYYQ